MNTIKTKDDVEIFYKDWGTGQPIVLRAIAHSSSATSPPTPFTVSTAPAQRSIRAWSIIGGARA
jgi:hypothetical protein